MPPSCLDSLGLAGGGSAMVWGHFLDMIDLDNVHPPIDDHGVPFF